MECLFRVIICRCAALCERKLLMIKHHTIRAGRFSSNVVNFLLSEQHCSCGQAGLRGTAPQQLQGQVATEKRLIVLAS